jgi:hypothetical protein
MCRSKPWLMPGFQQLASVEAPSAYAHWLRVATRSLYEAWFGSWVGLGADGLPDPSKDHIDQRFWVSTWGETKFYPHALTVKSGVSPADAIIELIANPTLWRLDCDHIVQISNLYATVKTLGKAKFDALVQPKMLLRKRESTGLKTLEHYARDEWNAPAYNPRENQPWRIVTAWVQDPIWVQQSWQTHPPVEFAFKDGELDATTEQLLRRAPPGSRVRWVNLTAPHEHEFRHENTVKLQDDIYVAGGLEDPITMNEYRRAALEHTMSSDKTPQGIRNTIIIDEIEIFEMHG